MEQRQHEGKYEAEAWVALCITLAFIFALLWLGTAHAQGSVFTGGSCTASHTYSTFDCTKAFDGGINVGQSWEGDVSTDQYLTYDIGTTTPVSTITWLAGGGTYRNDFFANTYLVVGTSADGATWTNIATTTITSTTDIATTTLPDSTSSRYWKFTVGGSGYNYNVTEVLGYSPVIDTITSSTSTSTATAVSPSDTLLFYVLSLATFVAGALFAMWIF